MSWRDTIEGLYKNRDFSELDLEQRRQAARDVINLSALASCSLSVAPIPLSELLTSTTVNVAMVVGVGQVYGKKLSSAQAAGIFAELVAVVGASYAARLLWSTLSKIIAPGIGGLLAMPYIYAVTWAMGRVAMSYFEDPDLDRGELKNRFSDFVKEGKRGFSEQKYQDFVRKSGGPGPEAAGQGAPAGSSARSQESVVEARWEDGPAPGQQTASGEGSSRKARKTSAKKARTQKASAKKTATKVAKKSTKKTGNKKARAQKKSPRPKAAK